MKVNIINIQKIEKEGMKLVGVAAITINDSLCVYDIKIVQGAEKLFIAMPSKKINETFKDVAHPTTIECRNVIENAVLKTYNGEKYDEGTLEEMRVTDIRIKPVQGSTTNIVAVASVVFNEQFVVNDVVLIKRDGMYTICLPSRKTPDGVFKNICELKDKELFYAIEKSIVDAYTKM